MNRLLMLLIVTAACMLLTKTVSGQSYSTTQGDILVLGTANTRSWSLQTQNLDCKADIAVSGDQMKLSSLTFIVKVENLEGHNVWMNRQLTSTLRRHYSTKLVMNIMLYTAVGH